VSNHAWLIVACWFGEQRIAAIATVRFSDQNGRGMFSRDSKPACNYNLAMTL
jgi:hypothetical protein